jgi:drug/metabolite transporter, DME family
MASVNEYPCCPINPSLWNSTRWGLLCCALSALSYAAANICLRKLSRLNCDPMWVVYNKELITVVVIGPWLLASLLRGRLRMPPLKDLAIIIATGLLVQIVGNLGMQWALGIIGLAAAVPVCYGLMLLSGAAFGWWILRETVSSRAVMAIGLLLVALILLGSGVKAASDHDSSGMPLLQNPPNVGLVAGAITAAGAAGVIYAILAIVTRNTLRRTTPTSVLMVIVTGAGVVTLGPITLLRNGAEIYGNTSVEQWIWIAAAGIFNLLGFLCISKGLQLTPVVHANVLNASQVAMAAVAGVLFFQETLPPLLIAGVVLTIAGIMLINRPQTAGEIVDAAV